ncbi:hypothetical protein CGLO_07712 [Colletotrichum gloeosporioides Cg-14]|uniref:Heterokaryon incompatibility domain-containing protein n=1 Tax=Colletotrichum gloeosporioides (strain Cg-14) TaxID=1237896 RepID=T0KBC3_COLGC|nr:hypothetical protein CGLO_07712 [Colletotrichum gloeosporioides Cg-14]
MGKIYTDCTNGLVWLGDLESNLNDSVFVEAHRECWSFAGDFSDYERLWARLVKVLGITRRESASVKRCTSNDAFKGEERILEVEWANYANRLSLGESAFHLAWFLRQLPERYPSRRTTDPYMNLPHPLFGSSWVEGNWSPYWESILNVLAIVVRDPWWRRLWVVQELALPPDVHFLFGPVAISLDIFTDALYFMQNCNIFNRYSSREGDEILDLASRHWK